MLTIKNVRNLFGTSETFQFRSESEQIVEGKDSWVFMPAPIDVGYIALSPTDINVELKDSVYGGVASLFNLVNEDELHKEAAFVKRIAIEKIPQHNYFYLELDPHNIEMMGKLKNRFVAFKIPSKPVLSADELDRAFQLAAQENTLLLFVCDATNSALTHQAIALVEKYAAQLLLLNVTTREEIAYLRKAKSSELLVYSAAAVEALADEELLWEALKDTTIDLIASGTKLQSKKMFMPLLLNGYHNKKITLDEIVTLTRYNVENILRLEHTNDGIIVDLDLLFRGADGVALKGAPLYLVIDKVAHPL